MVDGFPLAQKGRAGYAISAAVTTSTVNGLLWGCLVFLLLPWYTNLIYILGVPELWAFVLLAFVTVGFLTNQFWFRTVLAIAFGIFVGMVGVNPDNNEARFGAQYWFYLEDGIQIMAVAAGLFERFSRRLRFCRANRPSTAADSDVFAAKRSRFRELIFMHVTCLPR